MTSTTLPTWLTSPNPDVYLDGTYLVLDLETYVRDGHYGSAVDERNGLALACWSVGGSGVVHRCWGSEFEQQELVDAIGHVQFLVAHNAQYELGWLRRCGVDLRRVLVFDTKIAEYVLAGNLAAVDSDTGLAPISTSLDSCAQRRGDLPKDPVVDLWMNNGISVEEMPREWVEARCVQDVETTERLFLSQRQELNKRGQLGILHTRCIFTPVLADIAHRGMCLDPERVAETHAEYTELLGHVSKGLEELTGGINWRSTKQVGEFLYDKLGFAELRGRDGSPVRTAGGARLTDKASVEALRATTEEQRAFVSLRGRASKLASALSKNLNYFAGVCEHWNGIFRAEFNQTRTATHRISSSGITGPFGSCQLQNLPRAFKRLFTSRNPGWQVAESDGAQLEFRVAAYLGNDDQAKQDIRDPDFDIHSLSGSVIFNQPYDKFLAGVRAGVEKFKEWRTKAKKDTFKPLYGGQSGTASEKRWYATFRSRYSQLESTQKSWCNRVALKRMLKTSWGMRFYWPRAKLRRDGSLNVSASVYNYPVQCLATAEIIPIAVTYLWHRIAPISEQCFLVNTVHDSVVAELHPEVADTYTKIVSCSFSDDVYRYLKTVYNMDFDVELSSETKIGTHWGE